MTTPTTTVTPQRDNYMQALRAVCIIAVVIIHMPPSVGYAPSQQVVNFAVAIFFFIAGYFVNAPTFTLSHRLTRLVVPYVLWSILNLLFFNLAQWAHTGHLLTYDAGHIVRIIFFGAAGPQLYFVAVLVQLTLLTPLIIRLVRRCSNTVDALCFAVTPLYLVAIYLHDHLTGTRLPLYCALFPAWFGFYYAGVRHRYRQLRITAGTPLLLGLVLLALFLSFTEATYLIAYGLPWIAGSQLKFTSMLYAAALIALVLRHHQPAQPPSLLTRIGDCAFGIFFVHIFVKILLLQAIDSLLYTTAIYPIVSSPIITIPLVIALSYTLVAGIARLTPPRVAQYLGMK